MASYWAVARKLHSTGGSSSGATEPTRVDAQVPQLRRGRRVMRCCCVGRQGVVICRWCVFWLSTARAVAEGVSLPALPDAGIGKWILDQELDPIDDTLNIFAIFGSRIVHP